MESETTEGLQRLKQSVSHFFPHPEASVPTGVLDCEVSLVSEQQIYHQAANNCSI